MPQFLRSTAAVHRCLSHLHIRTFVNAKIKWARDPYLDTAVEREKNLKPLQPLFSPNPPKLYPYLLWERENVFCLREFLGIGCMRIKKALIHFPGIFYVSNKIRTQIVVLRETYRENFLVKKHPLMGMRNKYIILMNLVLRRGKSIRNEFVGRRGQLASRSKGSSRKDDPYRMMRVDYDED